MRIYGPTVYGWARKAGLQPSDASDVAQEVFSSVSRYLVRFRKRASSDSFRGWLWTVCRSKIHDHFRRVIDVPQAVGGSTANLRIQGLPVDPVRDDREEDRDEARRVSLNAVLEYRASFEAQVWEAFWGVAVEERPPADVARELGVSVWAVYKSKARVLQRLRQELDGLVMLEAS